MRKFKRSRVWAVAASIITTGMAFGAGAATLTFQEGVNGYASTSDTFLKFSEAATTHDQAIVLSDSEDPAGAGNLNQGLLRFDNIFGNGASQIPLGATITSATLSVKTSNTSANAHTLNRMIGNWDETATWNSMTNGISTDNVEARTAADASITPTVLQLDVLNVTTSLQAWSGGETNRGWAIIPQGTDGWQFTSSEGTAADRPLLSVTFQVPEPTSAALLGVGAIAKLGRRRRAD